MFVPVTYPQDATDEQLQAQEQQFFATTLDCQILAEVWEALASQPPLWCSPEVQLQDWSIAERMQELARRPDVRLTIMLKGVAAGLPPKTTRAMPPQFQADFLDQVRQNGEKSAGEQIGHFGYATLMIHTDRVKRVHQLLLRLNWEDDTPATKSLIATLISSALATDREYHESGQDKTHTPPITAHDLLSALNPLDYVTHVSREELAEIMRRRLEYEIKHQPHPAEEELEFITVDGLCRQMPTKCLRPAVELIFDRLGYPKPETASQAPADNGPATQIPDDGETALESELPEFHLDRDESDSPPILDEPGHSPKA